MNVVDKNVVDKNVMAALNYEGAKAGEGAGEYGMVTDLSGKSCNQTRYRYKSNIGAWIEEKVFVLRGPLFLYKFRVFNGSPKSGGKWSLVSSYDSKEGKADNVVFLANRCPSYDGTRKTPMCYVKSDGLTGSKTPEIFKGLLRDCVPKDDQCTCTDELQPSGAEIYLQTSKKCGKSKSGEEDCLGCPSEFAHHGWGGEKTLFHFRVQFLQGSCSDRPALWFLNSQIVRCQQYGCNCRGMGPFGGCFELDVAEVIENEHDSLHSENYCSDYIKKSCTNGYPNYAKRSSEIIDYVVIFDAPKKLIKILLFRDGSSLNISGNSLSDEYVTQLEQLTSSNYVKLLDDPHCLDCKHNFCGLCIREYARDYQHLGCPKCRLPIYPSEIIRNHSLQNLLQAWQSVEEALDSCSHDLEDDERNELCSSQQTETTLLLTQELQEYQKLVDEKAAFIQNYEISNLLREDSGDSNPSDVHSPNLESNAQDSEQPKSTAAEPIQYNPTESIRKNHTCVKRHVLATSSLTKTQRLTVKKACEALGGDLEHKLHQDVSTSSSLLVTHLITTSKSESLNNTSQKFRRCKRTAKYMLALANGIFIVDFSWILASLAAAQWIDEEKYEVDGDIHTEVMGKPRESRLHRVQTGRTSDIFSLFRFVLLFRLEDYEYHVDSLQAVVFAFEGRMLPEDHLSALETSENATRTCVGIVPRGTPAQSAREKYHQYHIPIVQIAWIVDCISHLEILPFGEYFPY